MEKQVKVIMAVACALACTLASVRAQTVSVTVDPAQSWIGYMNVSNLPADGGAYQFGSAWGTGDLQASFAGTTLTLAPNINVWETTDTYWVKADGISPNKNMDAAMYVENDAWAGSTVDFTGFTLANTLVSPYTSTAFIRDFVPDYSSFTTVTAALVPGVGWNISLPTTAGDHIQYGFETIGPDANPLTAAALGNVEVTAVPEPSSIALVLAGLSGLVMFVRKSRV
ncbi:MAG TPA: PEP-CTERM sorting domain-containing protein [Verrucomicrobiae bacterium]|nr:PEP-CTERM sorting domain-containing protein [Verrucomicrobiae bacterium]